MTRRIVIGAAAAHRLDEAHAWLSRRAPDEELLVVTATLEAGSALLARVAHEKGALFGARALTLPRIATAIGGPVLAERGVVAAGRTVLQAVCARVVHDLSRTGGLGRFQPIADRPGLVRAIARTVEELRLAGLSTTTIAARDPEVAPILAAYERALDSARLADRAEVLRVAAEVARRGDDPLVALPAVLVDAPIATVREAELVSALLERSRDVLLIAPEGDRALLRHLGPRVAVTPERPASEAEPRTALERLQAHVFDPAERPASPIDDGVVVLSSPGESRECVEIARRIHREVARGVPFDRIAVLLRAATVYRPHLQEALRRAAIPAHFAQGITRPDPAGRAFLALLACAADGLGARRFAEYLSLGQVPDRTIDGAPPDPAPPDARWVPADDDLLPAALASAPRPPVRDDDAHLPSPRRWEKLIVEASVIGGRDRWSRRLSGLRSELELDLRALDADDEPRALSFRKSLADLDALSAFALPLLESLDAFPELATWAVWLEHLGALASRALRRPDRVLSVLAELAPMGPIGPVSLSEVRLVLGARLHDLVVPPETTPEGRVFVAPIELARGHAFDVVFVPGLAEKVFPQKVVEDPILRDDVRAATWGLATNDDRVLGERLALRLAIGAAQRRVVLSWPRVDVENARPRVPSFYGLEVLRAAEGALTGFDELGRRAEHEGRFEGAAATRLGWPAPSSPADAIDDAEHDLALLASLLHAPEGETKGAARYLLDANPHLARALRFRARRWLRRWTPADGLVDPGPEARDALARHGFAHRSYSPTSLQHFAACPYRFVLQAIHRLAPREAPEPVEELDPLQRGSLVHEVLYELLVRLRDQGRLPLREHDFDHARDLLDDVVGAVAARWRDELAPAIDRVWDDGIASVRADVREWLARAVRDPEWVPWKFELSFGLRDRRAQDPSSTAEPALVAGALRLRGSIDLVERREDGVLRATDYKTGKVRAKRDAVVGGGETLQPVLYALALERLFPDAKVEGGRLYYCTSAGDYEEVPIRLDDYARRAAGDVIGIVGSAIESGFLPAAPAEGACTWCDYRPVCGPHEEQRVRAKPKDRLVQLRRLREMP